MLMKPEGTIFKTHYHFFWRFTAKCNHVRRYPSFDANYR